MGGDGGSIPKRADIVRTAGYRFIRNLGGMGYLPNSQVRCGSEKYTVSEDRLLRWTHCSLTNLPLRPPLVACRLGYLYNKESFIERFLNRKTTSLPSTMSHIKTRKDVKDLSVEFEATSGKLVCPITKVEFDSGVKGVFFWTCGCVVSCKALDQLSQKKSIESHKEVALPLSQSSDRNTSTPRVCPVCSTVYFPSDVVHLIPVLESVPELKRHIAESKVDRQSKKRKPYDQLPSSSTFQHTSKESPTPSPLMA